MEHNNSPYILCLSDLLSVFKNKRWQSWQNLKFPYDDFAGKNVLEIGMGVGFELLPLCIHYGAMSLVST